MARTGRKSAWIGDRAFYRMTLGLALPVMAQNGITQLVNMLDNIMVGSVGTEPMSGVAICNTLIFVFNLCVFGALSGAGIYGAQFFGRGDRDGVRSVFRFKVMTAAIISLVGVCVLALFPDRLIGAFLHESESGADLASALRHGKSYLAVMLWGLPAYALSQVYSTSLRECRATMLPMKASAAAVLVNLLGNWILIYGRFGMPALGVTGAAIATVIARWLELGVLLAGAHGRRDRYPWFEGVYATLRVPGPLAKAVLAAGLPLLANEGLWSTGMTVLTQSYSTRGLDAVAAWNIASTVNNVFIIAFQSMGAAVGIAVGNLLGAGRFDEAKETDGRLMAFSVELCIVSGLLMASLSPVFPRLYNTTDPVRLIARGFILVMACTMPLHAVCNSSYFTLRAGGLTRLTMLFDCGFVWIVSVPIAYCLSRFTSVPAIPLYACVMGADVFKALLGLYFVRKGKWIRNIVA